MGSYSQLNQYLREQNNKVFQLGKHDCFTFTNGAWEALYGEGYADGLIGKYDSLGPKSFKRLLVENYGQEDIVSCLDEHMRKVQGFPPKGCLVITSSLGRWITGKALGISMGARCAFVADKGLRYIPTSEVEEAWLNEK